MHETTGAEWLARAIASTGTTHVFFIEAVLRRTLIALEAQGVERVLAHSEKAVAYMADGYARVAGRPAFCFAQSVGAANLAAALQDPWLGHSPVVALTGRKPPVKQYRNAYQEIAHAPLFAPVTKFNAPVEAASDLPRLLRQAVRTAVAGTPRPVHLDLNGVQGEIVETGPVDDDGGLGRARKTAAAPAGALPGATSSAPPPPCAGRPRWRSSPARGRWLSGAGPEVMALAELLMAPVATSLGARALVPSRHPLAVGVLGFYAAPPANRIVHQADLVLFVGCDTCDQLTNTWRTPAPGTRVVQIDIDPEELGRSYADTLGLMGDPRATVAGLIEAVGTPQRDGGYAEWAAGVMAEWRAEMAPLMASEDGPIRVERLCAEIAAALPEDGILFADTGYSGIWTGTCVDFNGAGQGYQRAAGSLGWAYPASLGGKLAAPEAQGDVLRRRRRLLLPPRRAWRRRGAAASPP